MAPYHIVLADQQSLIRNGLIRIIEQTGDYRVIGEADNSSSLIKLVRHSSPDLIVLDLNLPFIGGIDAFIECKGIRNGLQGLLLTTDHRHLRQALPEGIQGYLLKDNADTELVAAINQIEKGKKFISRSLQDGSDDLFSLEKKGRKAPFASYDILSAREKQILRMIAAGMLNREIADVLHISVRTVEHHRANVIRKLGVRSPANLCKVAVYLGYISISMAAMLLTNQQTLDAEQLLLACCFL